MVRLDELGVMPRTLGDILLSKLWIGSLGAALGDGGGDGYGEMPGGAALVWRRFCSSKAAASAPLPSLNACSIHGECLLQ